MSNYSEESVAAAVQTLHNIRMESNRRTVNLALKYRYCPLCKIPLEKVLRHKRVWRCSNCSLTITPNIRKVKKSAKSENSA